MRTIYFYLLRQQAVAMIFITVALTCAIWLTQSLRFIKLIINQGLSIVGFLKFTVLLLPTFLLIILPIALFFSILFTYNKLINDREVVAMRTCGASEIALAAPALTLALVVTMISFAISLYLMPISFRQFKVTEFAMRNEYSVLLLQEGRFNSVTSQLTIYVRERRANNELLGVLVQDNRQPQKPVTMMAERGVMIGSESEPRIVMFNGNRQELDRATGRIRFLTFERWSFSIDWLSTPQGARWRQPNERFIGELLDPGDSPDERYYRKKLIAEGHNRLLVPLYSLVFALIGLACLLVGEFDRRGQTKRILLTVGIVIPLQAAAIVLFNLAAKVPAVLPLMYLNVLVPAIVCIWILTRSQRLRARRFVAGAPAGAA